MKYVYLLLILLLLISIGYAEEPYEYTEADNQNPNNIQDWSKVPDSAYDQIDWSKLDDASQIPPDKIKKAMVQQMNDQALGSLTIEQLSQNNGNGPIIESITDLGKCNPDKVKEVLLQLTGREIDGDLSGCQIANTKSTEMPTEMMCEDGSVTFESDTSNVGISRIGDGWMIGDTFVTGAGDITLWTEKDGTMIVTIDGNDFTNIAAGSTINVNTEDDGSISYDIYGQADVNGATVSDAEGYKPGVTEGDQFNPDDDEEIPPTDSPPPLKVGDTFESPLDGSKYTVVDANPDGMGRIIVRDENGVESLYDPINQIFEQDIIDNEIIGDEIPEAGEQPPNDDIPGVGEQPPDGEIPGPGEQPPDGGIPESDDESNPIKPIVDISEDYEPQPGSETEGDPVEDVPETDQPPDEHVSIEPDLPVPTHDISQDEEAGEQIEQMISSSESDDYASDILNNKVPTGNNPSNNNPLPNILNNLVSMVDSNGFSYGPEGVEFIGTVGESWYFKVNFKKHKFDVSLPTTTFTVGFVFSFPKQIQIPIGGYIDLDLNNDDVNETRIHYIKYLNKTAGIYRFTQLTGMSSNHNDVVYSTIENVNQIDFDGNTIYDAKKVDIISDLLTNEMLEITFESASDMNFADFSNLSAIADSIEIEGIDEGELINYKKYPFPKIELERGDGIEIGYIPPPIRIKLLGNNSKFLISEGYLGFFNAEIFVKTTNETIISPSFSYIQVAPEAGIVCAQLGPDANYTVDDKVNFKFKLHNPSSETYFFCMDKNEDIVPNKNQYAHNKYCGLFLPGKQMILNSEIELYRIYGEDEILLYKGTDVNTRANLTVSDDVTKIMIENNAPLTNNIGRSYSAHHMITEILIVDTIKRFCMVTEDIMIEDEFTYFTMFEDSVTKFPEDHLLAKTTNGVRVFYPGSKEQEEYLNNEFVKLYS